MSTYIPETAGMRSVSEMKNKQGWEFAGKLVEEVAELPEAVELCCEEVAEKSAQIAKLLGNSNNVTVTEQLDKLESFETDFFDAIIVNKFIVENKVIHDTLKLDKLVALCIRILKMNGSLVVREDFQGFLATKVITALTNFFDVYRTTVGNEVIGLEFYSLNQIDSSITEKRNFMDVYWTLRKNRFDSATNGYDAVTFRDFLDKTQYTDTGIHAYEFIFGDEFISPGGAEENLNVLKRFGELKSGQKMLDIGVGIGGGARQAAKEFDLKVLGVDLSSNMLSIGMDRLQRDKDQRVRYQIANALKYEYDEGSFDVIFSRDCMQHNDEMGTMMKRIFKWLKPGGRVLITMYGKGHGDLTPKFKNYVAQRHYFLKTLEEMVDLTKAAGFQDVKGTNLTPRFKQILIQEKEKAEAHKEEFLKKFSAEKFDDLISGWNDKLEYIRDDNHNWIQIFAVKPRC